MPKKPTTKKRKKSSKAGNEIKILALVVGAIILGAVVIHPSMFALWQQQNRLHLSQSDMSGREAKSAAYKPSILGSEIPSTWSHAFLGDVGPMPIPKDSWLDLHYVVYSFASRVVSLGDLNWEQVDVYQMENEDLPILVSKWKSDEEFNLNAPTWATEMVDGQSIDVVTFATEEDGSTTKGATGGKIYFIPGQTKNPGSYTFALVIAKQAKGTEEFENGFTHFLQRLDLDEIENMNFTPY